MPYLTFRTLEERKNLSSVRIMLLENWQCWKKKFLQGFRQQVTWPWRRQQPGSCPLEERYGHWSPKTVNLATIITVRTWLESPTRGEKKVRTRSLAEAKLKQLCYGFICHPQVLFKFILFNKSLFPHFQLLPSGFRN